MDTTAIPFVRRLQSSAKALVPPSVRVAKRARAGWRSGEPELHLVPQLCRRGAMALDVGANGGVYAWHMARSATGVIAFEPNPHHAAFLQRAFVDRVRVSQVALSDRDGTARLRIPVEEMQDGRATIEAQNDLGDAASQSVIVSCRRLDGIALPRPVGLIKIDVEGHELAVLTGASALLARDRPNLIVEAEERHRKGAVEGVSRYLARFGYRGHFLQAGVLTDMDQLGDDAGKGARAAERGICNFVFRPGH